MAYNWKGVLGGGSFKHTCTCTLFIRGKVYSCCHISTNKDGDESDVLDLI